ncbi:hypothetical protein [Heliophilum fasciatum]|uniref:Uncharacterized protein n=1 Tax=Heliophilum fasciatum TaxID=35700 RepID=A0A4R2RE27_9FIRM|nr:hypothetical protein [Heliophilum fasciatum]MCW2279021.1 hypothetical protein [Heliophilum fasciatum]TCP61742.1 hypothetical protein EDD73_12613 [Heliophilum fasciatum]
MWVTSTYELSNLFSLRVSSSTSSGGKSHLIPTPYVVKMALINASFRWDGRGKEDFSWIRPLTIAFKTPQKIVVSNQFVKIMKEARDGDDTYQQTVGLRQYVYWEGPLGIAFEVSALSAACRERLMRLCSLTNYFGKRGSFVQFMDATMVETLPEGYSFLFDEIQPDHVHQVITKGMLIQLMDDMAGKASFETFDSYSPARMKLFEDRVFKPVVLSSVKGASSRGYTMYDNIYSSET